MVIRTRKVYNTKTKLWDASEEVSWYVCNSDKYSPQQLHDAIRNHWAIENANHFVKDTAMGEDSSKIRKKASIIASFRSFTLNLLRANNITNIRQALLRNGCNIENVWKLKYIF